MYKAKYELKLALNSDEPDRTESRLVAKFDFKKEVAPKDREDVRNRIKDLKKDKHFFRSEEKYRDLYMNSHIYALGFGCLTFTLGMITFKRILPEQMIDLKDLNNYILTGKQ